MVLQLMMTMVFFGGRISPNGQKTSNWQKIGVVSVF